MRRVQRGVDSRPPVADPTPWTPSPQAARTRPRVTRRAAWACTSAPGVPAALQADERTRPAASPPTGEASELSAIALPRWAPDLRPRLLSFGGSRRPRRAIEPRQRALDLSPGADRSRASIVGRACEPRGARRASRGPAGFVEQRAEESAVPARLSLRARPHRITSAPRPGSSGSLGACSQGRQGVSGESSRPVDEAPARGRSRRGPRRPASGRQTLGRLRRLRRERVGRASQRRLRRHGSPRPRRPRPPSQGASLEGLTLGVRVHGTLEAQADQRAVVAAQHSAGEAGRTVLFGVGDRPGAGASARAARGRVRGTILGCHEGSPAGLSSQRGLDRAGP